MTVAVVHGESDTLLTIKDDKILTGLGRMWARGGGDMGYYEGDDFDWVAIGEADMYYQCWRSDQKLLWNTMAFYDHAYEDDFSHCAAVVKQLIDDDEYIYLLTYEITGNGPNLTKIDSNVPDSVFWSVIWQVRIEEGADVKLTDMCFDHSGHLILCGFIYSEYGSGGPNLWKVNCSDGSVIWYKSTPDGRCLNVAVDSNDNIYVACEKLSYGDEEDDSKGCLQKYDADGNFLAAWSSEDDEIDGLEVEVSPDDEIFFSTHREIDAGDGDATYIQVFDTSLVLQRSFTRESLDPGLPYPNSHPRAAALTFDDDGNFLFIIWTPHVGVSDLLYKMDTSLNIIFCKEINDGTGVAHYRPAISFTPHKRIFVSNNRNPFNQIRDENTGEIIRAGLLFSVSWGEYGDLGLWVIEPFFKPAKLWTDLYFPLNKNEDTQEAVRDSGCFLNPNLITAFQSGVAGSPDSVSVGDRFHRENELLDNNSFQQGYIQSRFDAVDDQWAYPFDYEVAAHKLNRTIAKPFQNWPFSTHEEAEARADKDIRFYYVNAFIFAAFNGKYYQCIKTSIYLQSLLDEEYYKEVSPPNPKWDSFAGFGGWGEYDTENPESTTPQIYTVVFHGVEDLEGAPHPTNGIYYFRKDWGSDHAHSAWRFRKYRPGGISVVGEFIMAFQEIGGYREYTLPACWVKLGQVVPPGEAWSSETNYDVDDWSLHKGNWYKCTECEVIEFESGGYTPCVASDIGKTVIEKDPLEEYERGKLAAYDNTLRKWWIQYDQQLLDNYDYYIKGGTGYGTPSGWSTTTGGAHTNKEPPNGIYWTHILENEEEFRDFYKIVFKTATCEDNYGCMMDWRNAANQNSVAEIGQNGTVSVYPGAIYQWNSRKNYVTDNIVVWNGCFYQADNNNTNSEPPSGDWTLLGHTS